MSSVAPPLITLAQEFDEARLVWVKLIQVYDHGMYKCEAPVFDGTKMEALFYRLLEFCNITTYLEFDPLTELFNNFWLTLSGVAKEHWDSPNSSNASRNGNLLS